MVTTSLELCRAGLCLQVIFEKDNSKCKKYLVFGAQAVVTMQRDGRSKVPGFYILKHSKCTSQKQTCLFAKPVFLRDAMPPVKKNRTPPIYT